MKVSCMGMRGSYMGVLAFGMAILIGGCSDSGTSANFCDEKIHCTNPEVPFCDLLGQYPESNGVRNVCIATPADLDGGVPDAVDTDADVSTETVFSVDQSAVDFANVETGKFSNATRIKIENIGEETIGTAGSIAISVADNTNFDVTESTCGATLVPNAFCSFSVVFMPKSVDSHETTLTVSAEPGGQNTVELSGTGTTAALKDLRVTSWHEIPLEPSFSPQTNAYVSYAASVTRTVTITPTATDTNAVIAVNGETVSSGEASAPIVISSEKTTATISVTAENAESRTYVVSLYATADPTEFMISSDDPANDDDFGWSMAIDGDWMVIGDRLADVPKGATVYTDAGVAHVFRRSDDGTWTYKIRLVAPNAAEGDHFGENVAIDGNRIVVGAYMKDEKKGAAYLFELQDGTWKELANFTATDSGAGDSFGYSVAIDGNRIVAGALNKDNNTGAVYVFYVSQDGKVYQDEKLTASDASEYSLFGKSVAIDDSRIVVGANTRKYFVHDSLSAVGAAYVFRRQDNGDWLQEALLLAEYPEEYDYFGSDVAIDNSHIVAGATGDESKPGFATVFSYNQGKWSRESTLRASNGANGDQFGYKVAIDGNQIAVGAYAINNAAGAAYVFRREDSLWKQASHLTASDASDEDRFGISVAVDGNYVAVGAREKTVAGGSKAGAVYIYQ